MYFAVIGDIVDSKKIFNRSAVQELLKATLNTINREYEDQLASRFSITLGDEFQGLLYPNGKVLEIIDRIRFTMLTQSVLIRFGIGIGEMNTRIHYEDSMQSDGAAYWCARQAIGQLHKMQPRKSGIMMQAAPSLDEHMKKQEQMLVNNSLSYCVWHSGRWLESQIDFVHFILSNWGYSSICTPQVEMAKALNCSPQALNNRLNSTGLLNYTETMQSIQEEFFWMAQQGKSTYAELARKSEQNGNTPEEEFYYEQDLNRLRELAEKKPAVYLPDVAAACSRLGEFYIENCRTQEAEDLYREALEIRRRLVAESPAVYLPDAAASCSKLGELCAENGNPREAETLYREALDTYHQLAAKSPSAYLRYEAATCSKLGNICEENDQPEEAEKMLRKALSIRRKQAAENPVAYLPDAAAACCKLGDLCSANGRSKEAMRLYREALHIYRQLAAEPPAAYLPDVAYTCNKLGDYNAENGYLREAEALYQEALDAHRQLATMSPAAYRSGAAAACSKVGTFYAKSGRTEEAEELYREASGLRSSQIKDPKGSET